MNPNLKFDHVLNVRDFGGQSIETGGRVCMGKLYRGAQLSQMSSSDRTYFQELNVSLVSDLRYHTERKRQPSNWQENYKPQTLEFLPALDQAQSLVMAPHERFVLHELKGPDDARRYMLGSYNERPLKPGFVDIVARTLKHMAQTGDGLYVHCAAGKDRTGTFAAIVLLLLGVSLDDIMEDYLQTQTAVDLDVIIPIIAAKMEARHNRSFDQDALRPFFGVTADYLQNSLKVIGDIEHYAANIIGLNEEEIASFKTQYSQA